MPTIITTFTNGAGRGAITVDQTVEEVSRAINEEIRTGGGPFIKLINSQGQQVAVRVDSICGIFETKETDDGPSVTIGRAGHGAAMMQMSISHGGGG